MQFSNATVNSTAIEADPTWPARYAAHELYYAEVAYHAAKGVFGANLRDVAPLANFPMVLAPDCMSVQMSNGKNN